MPEQDYLTLDDFDYQKKRVLLRVDINSPLGPKTKRIVSENRINKSMPILYEEIP